MKITIKEKGLAQYRDNHPDHNLDGLTSVTFEWDVNGRLIDCKGTTSGATDRHIFTGPHLNKLYETVRPQSMAPLPQSAVILQFPQKIIEQTAEAAVYWLYDATCHNPYTDGYVGTTDNLEQRLSQHQRGPLPAHKAKILFQGTIKECQHKEEVYRPRENMGWNKARGGNPLPTIEQRHIVSQKNKKQGPNDASINHLRRMPPMTGKQYKIAIGRLGLSDHGIATLFDTTSHNSRRWARYQGKAKDARPIPMEVAMILRYMVNKGISPEEYMKTVLVEC